MSSPDHDDTHVRDGHDDNVWDDGATPSFDNEEAGDVLDEGHEGPLDVVEKSPGEEPVRKKSNLAFYGAVGAFALAAIGLVAFKAGLLRPSKTTAPTQTASIGPSNDELAAKPAPLLTAAAAPTAGADVFGPKDSASAGRGLEADAAVLGEAGGVGTPVKSPEPAHASKAVDVSEPGAAGAEATRALPTTPVAAIAPAAPVVPVAAPVLAPSPSEAPAPSAPAVATATPAQSISPTRRKHVSPRSIQTARAPSNEASATTKTEKVVKAGAQRAMTSPASRSAPGTTKVAKRSPAKESRPDAAEILTGWKLHGTWPQRGPGQLAWVADAHGKLQTVAVGQRVGGAEVLAIGKRGEMVQTTAGQIRP